MFRQQQQQHRLLRAIVSLLCAASLGAQAIMQSQSLGSIRVDYAKDASIVEEFPSLTKFLKENDNIQSSGLFDFGSYLIVDVVHIMAVCDDDRTECACAAQLLHPDDKDKNVHCHSCTVVHFDSQNPAFGANVDCTNDDPAVPNCAFQCDSPEIEFHVEQIRICGLDTCIQQQLDDEEGDGKLDVVDQDGDGTGDVVYVEYVEIFNGNGSSTDEDDVEYEETPDGPVKVDRKKDKKKDGTPGGGTDSKVDSKTDKKKDGSPGGGTDSGGDAFEVVHWVETQMGPVRVDQLVDTTGDGVPDMIDQDGDGIGDIGYDFETGTVVEQP